MVVRRFSLKGNTKATILPMISGNVYKVFYCFIIFYIAHTTTTARKRKQKEKQIDVKQN